MLRLQMSLSDYDDFKRLVAELHNVSTWYNETSGGQNAKFVSIGMKNHMEIAICTIAGFLPSSFHDDFPDAIAVGAEDQNPFRIDGQVL